MLFRSKLFAVLIVLLWVGPCQYSQAQNNVREVINKMVHHDTQISSEKTPGYIIAVIDGDSTFIESFGRSLDDDHSVLSPLDLFELGGLSKVITSIIFHDLAAEYKINLDDNISPHFPDSIKPSLDRYGWSYNDLLTHTTGLPKSPLGLGLKEGSINSPYAYYTMADLISTLPNYSIDKKKVFKYSHVNYALIEYIMEDITDQSFKIILQNRLRRIFGIQHAELNEESTLTNGYTRSRKISEPQLYASFGASLGIRSNLNDLIKITKKLIQLNSSDSDDPLSPLLNKQINTGLGKRLHFTSGLYQMDFKKFYPLYLHSGRSKGHYAFIGFVPDTRTGVVILANSVEGTEDLGLLTLRMVNNTWKRKSTNTL